MQLISKAEARRLNLKKYFTGIPCRNNHIDFRYVNTGICYHCKRDLNRNCNLRNRKTALLISRRCYQKNKSNHLKNSKKWALNNPDKVREIKKRNKLKYKEKYKKSERERVRNKRKNDLYFRLCRNLSKEVWAFCFDKKIKKSKNWRSYISFTVNELKNHLESKFDSKLSWENYGSYWEIDHIIPLYEFRELPLEEALKKAWKLDNLQPLEKNLNRSKQHRKIATREELITTTE